MKISIITATYNSAATVRDTLQSVAGQRHPNVEHIVQDGRSTDATLAIVSEFPHVARVVSEKDGGIYEAMNRGLAAATGEVIGILNSDDVYADDRVLEDVARVLAEPGVDGCYADLQYVRADDPGKIVRTWRSGRATRRSFYYGWMPPHPTVFLRRRVYERTGPFDLTLASAADYELMLRVFVKLGAVMRYIPRVMVRMRAGGMSNVSLRNRLRANREDRMAWRLNGLEPYFFTLHLKPLRKVFQFVVR